MSDDQIILEGSILESTANAAKQEVLIDLIREGFGNARDGHYYGANLLEREAAKFGSAKMYVNHIDPETEKRLNGLPRPVEHLGGRILETRFLRPGESAENFGTNQTDKAVLRGRAKVAQPWLWHMIESDPELLGVSIHAGGRSNPGQMEGRQAKIVEAISNVRSVDWVTEAGAGGKVFALVEAQITAEEAPVSGQIEAPASDEVLVASLKEKGMNDSQARAFSENILQRRADGETVTEAEIAEAVEAALEAPASDTPLSTSASEAVEANAIDPARIAAKDGFGTKGQTDQLDAKGGVNDLKTSKGGPVGLFLCPTCAAPMDPAGLPQGSVTCPNGHTHASGAISPAKVGPDAVGNGNPADMLDSKGQWSPNTTSGMDTAAWVKMEAAAKVVLEALDPEDALEGAAAGAEIEGDVDDELAEAWKLFSAFAQGDKPAALALVESLTADLDDDEHLEADEMDTEQIEARAVELAEAKLDEALAEADKTLRAEYEGKFQEMKARFESQLAEAHKGFERRLAQKDQRVLAAQIIEQAGFKPRTCAALKEQFHDAFFESETDEEGTVVKSGDDFLRAAVKEAIDTKRAELSAYVETRVSGAGESDGSLREAGGQTSGVRAKKAPLDSEIDSIIGIDAPSADTAAAS